MQPNVLYKVQEYKFATNFQQRNTWDCGPLMLNAIKRLALELEVGTVATPHMGPRWCSLPEAKSKKDGTVNKKVEEANMGGWICSCRARTEIAVELLEGALCYRPLPIATYECCTCGMYQD